MWFWSCYDDDYVDDDDDDDGNVGELLLNRSGSLNLKSPLIAGTTNSGRNQ